MRWSFALKLSYHRVVPISRISNRRSENILKRDFAILFPLQPSNKFAAPHCVPYYIPNSLKYIGLLCRQLNSRVFFTILPKFTTGCKCQLFHHLVNDLLNKHCVQYYIPNSLKYVGLCRQLNKTTFFQDQ